MTDKKLEILISAVDKATVPIKKVSKSIGELEKVTSTFGDTFKAIATYDIGKNIALSIAEIGKQAISLAGNLEQTRIAFTTMTGDARIADAFIREMTQFAKTTPFEIGQLETASKQLLAYGFEIENILPTLKAMGDIASGVGMDKLPNLIYALGQVRAAGKLTGNELRQFTESGVPLLEELGKTLGKSVGEIQTMVSEGKIGFSDVEKALKGMTSEGGRFFNLMEAQSKSFGGMVSNFKDTITIMLRDLGTEFLPGLKKVLAETLKFWDENGAAMSVSFSGMVTELVSFFGEGLSAIVKAVDAGMGFFQENTKEATGEVALSWKNLFLYLQTGLQGLKTVLHLVGNFISYNFASAFWDVQIAWEKLQGFISGNSIGSALSEGIADGVQSAIDSLNGLIDGLNKVPGFEIGMISWKPSSLVKLDQSIVDSRAKTNANIVSLEAQKNKQLLEINRIAKDQMISDIGEIESAYMKFTDAQKKGAGNRGKTLAEVLKEIGKGVKAPGAGGGEGGDTKKGVDETKKAMEELKALGEKTASALEGVYGKVSGSIDSQRGKLLTLKGEYEKLKDKLKEVGETGVTELQKIQDKLDEQAGKMKDITGEGQMDIAKRLIEARKDLEKIVNKPVFGEQYTAEDIEKIQALRKEISLGESSTTEEERAKAVEESQKSEIQLIMDKTKAKLKDAEDERLDIQKTYDTKKRLIEEEKKDITLQINQKKSEIESEFKAYKSLIEQRKKLEENYFSVFQQNIKDQMDKTKEAINLMNELQQKKAEGVEGARALGGPVSANRSYLVGENGPEIFIPGSSGKVDNGKRGGGQNITINMGGVTVQGEADENRLVQKIKQALIRDTQLYSNGIA